MRAPLIGLFIVLILALGSILIVGVTPMTPAVQHVEQRIPDAQIPR